MTLPTATAIVQPARETEQQLITLTPKQASDREMHVSVIHEKVKGFLEIGFHLTCLRDEGLYLKTHTTFEAFIQDEFDFSVRHAERLIKAFDVVKELSSECEILPQSERHARLLASLDDATVRRNVWEQTVKETIDIGKRVTTKAIEAVTDRIVNARVNNLRPAGRTANSSSGRASATPDSTTGQKEEGKVCGKRKSTPEKSRPPENPEAEQTEAERLRGNVDGLIERTIGSIQDDLVAVEKLLERNEKPGFDREAAVELTERLNDVFLVLQGRISSCV
jgi:hypothetical protein